MRLPIFSIFFLLFTQAQAQTLTGTNYPKNYFNKPLNIPVSLAGNFGALRSNHYHMGLDFRTQQRENLPVMAAAEGYISRIKTEPYGYGNAIYITHPNGLVTLYAHLNSFYAALENYVIAKQCADKKWHQDFDVPPGLFVVKKGQFIAYSGNTGSSEGPHLHFEIRDKKNGNNLNPLLFGLGVGDNIPPVFNRLALYNRNETIYENAPLFVKIKKVKRKNKIIPNAYESMDSVIKIPLGKFSFGIGAEDKTNESFMFGIYRAELYVDSILQCAFSMNNFSYDDSRYINAGIDYSTRYDGGPYIQHLCQLPGNRIGIFDTDAGNGVLQLNDDTIHSVQIIIKDVMGNRSSLQLKMQRDSLAAFNKYERSAVAKKLDPNKNEVFENDAFSVKFHQTSLYDTVYATYSTQPKQMPYVSAIHSFSDYHTPVHDSIVVSIKAKANLPDSVKQKTVMLLRSGRKFDVQKGSWKGDWVEAKWWNFGQFFLWKDTIKPILTPVNVYDSAVFIKDRKLVFNAKDEIGDLQCFEGFIDGAWVIFKQNDNTYTYSFDDRCLPGWHTLKAVATDAAGNTKEYTCTFHNGIVPKPEPLAIEQ
jgi:Peptidase family M23